LFIIYLLLSFDPHLRQAQADVLTVLDDQTASLELAAIP
jgi:hypothetical protein